MDKLTKVQRVSAYGLAVSQQRVLLVRIGDDNPRHSGQWMWPGGGIEHGEHPEQTVIRELAEETGLTVTVDHLLDAGSEHRRDHVHNGSAMDFHSVYLVYAVTVTGGQVRPEAAGTTRSPSWVRLDQLAELRLLESIREPLIRIASQQ